MTSNETVPLTESHEHWDVLDELLTRHLSGIPSSLAAGCSDETAGVVENVARDVCDEVLADCRKLIADAKTELSQNSFSKEDKKCSAN